MYKIMYQYGMNDIEEVDSADELAEAFTLLSNYLVLHRKDESIRVWLEDEKGQEIY